MTFSASRLERRASRHRPPVHSRALLRDAAIAVCGVLVAAGPATRTTTAQNSPAAGVVRTAARPLAGRYIVVLRGFDDPEAVAYQAAGMFGGALRHVYRTAVRGFALHIPPAAARALARDPRVAFVEEDGLVMPSDIQANPPSWGLDRIDQRAPAVQGNSAYRYNANGTGVNAYVVDSGIRSSHEDFGGRVFAEFSAITDAYGMDDCYGHGTHVAGILGGAQYGVAKNVTLHTVRVFDCNGTGSWSGIIAAMDWITANHVKPAVANLSLSGAFTSAANDAVQGAIAAGVVVVASAGNDGWDACRNSPASVSDAIVVGSSDRQDSRSSWSNFGPCVDLFAPGSAITSASIASNTATTQMSGTSMSAPHVAGAAALYLQGAPNATPAQVQAALVKGATAAALQNAGETSPNRLLFTAFLGDRVAPKVSLTAPAAGARVTGTVTITATATDDVEVAKVLFYAGTTLIGTDTTAPYSVNWDTSGAADGSSALYAQAQDTAGNLHNSATVSATIANSRADTIPPTVSFASPVSGAALSGTVVIEATARDNLAIRQVSFYAGTRLLATDTAAPYAIDWDTRAETNGAATLKAIATDQAGNSSSVTRAITTANGALVDPWIDTDIGSPGKAGGATYAGAVFRIAAGGRDLWSTADAFNFVHRTWTGDGDLVARVADLVAPPDAAFAMAGLMFRESTAAGSRHAAIVIGTNGKVKFRRRTADGGTTLSDGPTTGSARPPKWLKLVRRGAVFTAYMSDDGAKWTAVHTAQTIPLGATLEVGVFGLRDGGTQRATATLGSVQLSAPMAAGWSSADVGAVGRAGQTSMPSAASDNYTVAAAGTDLWGSADAFRTIYRPWTGDADVIARVAALTTPAGSAFTLAAVTIRESLDDNARHVSLIITSQGKVKFRRRTVVGGSTASDGPSSGVTIPRWLKLTRRGNVFTGYVSADGISWDQIHTPQTVALAGAVNVGLVALRSGGTELGQAVFTNLTVK